MIEKNINNATSDDCGACIRCLDASGIKSEFLPGILVPVSGTLMVLCATCGNKRCPHAKDHRHTCTNSNDPGQKGSSYEGACDFSDTFSAVATESNPVMRRLFERRSQLAWEDASDEARRNFAQGYASAIEFFFGIEHAQ